MPCATRLPTRTNSFPPSKQKQYILPICYELSSALNSVTTQRQKYVPSPLEFPTSYARRGSRQPGFKIFRNTYTPGMKAVHSLKELLITYHRTRHDAIIPQYDFTLTKPLMTSYTWHLQRDNTKRDPFVSLKP